MADRSDTDKLIMKLEAEYGKETAARLVAYVDRVLEINEHINLTAVRDRDEAMQKHLADSLAASGLPEFKEAESVIDIGTGAGFPGALLAIAYPEKKFTLLDSTLKRLRVIDGIAEELGISNIYTVHARAEEISRKSGFGSSFDICVSRAVASLDKLSGWCLPFVRKGGKFISYKGQNFEAEISEAAGQIRKYGGRVDRTESYGSGSEDISGHVLVIIEKIR